MTEKKMTTNQRIEQNKPLEVWQTLDGSWRWEVYKKNQKNDDKPFATWFCKVYSPFVPNGELGDVYVQEIKEHAMQVFD